MPELVTVIFDNPLIIFLAIATIAFAVLFLNERDRRSQLSKRNQILIEQIQDQSAAVIQEAMAKAQSIIERAAVEETQLMEGSRQSVSKIEQLYSNFLVDLQNRGETTQSQVFETLKIQTTSSLEKIEQNLADFLHRTQQQSIGSIQLEVQSARQLVEVYKKRQLSAIDENIVAILERTLGQVLSKRLTLKDHLDLVYEALEKAKIEKFIV